MRYSAMDGIRQFLFFTAAASGFFGISACSLAEKFGRSASSSSGFTEVHFSRHAFSSSPVIKDTLVSGVVIYAKSDSGVKSVAVPSESASATLRLQNGDYQFFAVGWPAGGITADPSCGLGSLSGGIPGETITLNGTTTLVTITVTQADCAGADFNESSYTFSSLPLPLRVNFCSTETDTSGFTDVSSCTTGNESSLFVAGHPAGQIYDTDGIVGHDIVVFTADPFLAGRKDLFSISFSDTGNLQKRISGKLINNPGVSNHYLSPDGSKVAYIATADGANKSLWITSSTRQSPTKLSIAGPSYNVQGAMFTPDGESIVYVADEGSPGKNELYFINADGSGKRKLSAATMVGTQGVKIASNGPMVQVSSDGEWAVYVADQDDDAKDEVYKVSLTSVSAPVKLNDPTTPATLTTLQLEVTPDASRVVWVGEFDTPSKPELYSANLSGAPVETKINSAVTNGVAFFTMDKGHDDGSQGSGKVVYIGDFLNAGINDIRAVNADGSNSLNLSNVLVDDGSAVGGDGITVMGSNIRVKFNADGSKVLYLRKIAADGANRRRLFVANTSGVANQVQLTSIVVGDGVPNVGPIGGNEHYDFALGDTKVVYVADQDAALGTKELWMVNIDGTSPTKISNVAAGRDVQDFAIAGGSSRDEVVYRADKDTDDLIEIYHSAIAAAPVITKISPASPDPGFDHAEYHYNADDNSVMYVTKGAASSGQEMRIYDLDLAGDYVVAETGPLSPVGRFKVHVVAIDATTDGSVSGFAPALSTACLTAPANDGDAVNTNAKIPAGLDSGLVPMAVAVEVFPRATSCSGPSVPFILPFGMARGDLVSPASATAKLAGDGLADLLLFVTDP